MTDAPPVGGGTDQSAPDNPASGTSESAIRKPTVAGPVKSRLYNKVTARFVYWFLGFALLPLTVLIGVSLHQTETAIHDEALRRLLLLATEKHFRIEDYIRQVKEASQRASSEPYVRALLEAASQSPGRVQELLADQLRAELHPILGSDRQVSILDRAGRVIVSTEPRFQGADFSREDFFLRAQKVVALSDITYDTLNHEMTWMVASPVMGEDRTTLGVIVNRIDTHQLTTLTNGRMSDHDGETDDPQSGFTGRVYLVNRNGLLLSQVSSFPDTIFSQVIDTRPIRYARDNRKSMCGEYTDVRQVRVAGATEIISEFGWVLVAEMDYDQAMAPYVRFRNGILILTAVVFALMIVLVLRLGVVVARPLRTLILAEEKLTTDSKAGAVIPEDQIPDNEMGALIRRRNEVIQRVLAAEKRHRDLVDEIDGIAWEAEVGTWRFTFVNRQAEQILGYSAQQWLSEPGFWVKHLHPLDRSRTVQAYLEASITGKSLQLEYRMIASDGRAVWLRDQAHLILGTAGADGYPVRQLRGLMIDVTSAKQAQELLQESERRSRTIIEMSRDAIIGIDSKGFVSVFNHAAEQMFQIPAREVIGTPPARLVPEDLRDRHIKAITHFLETGRSNGVIGQPKELKGMRSDGSVFPMEISLTPTSDRSIRILASIQDITTRVKAEEDLRARYHLLDGLHQLTDAVIHAESIDEIYAQAISCGRLSLKADRAAIVLSEPDGYMRFKAWDGLSEEYRIAMNGRRPWRDSDTRPRPLVVSDVQLIVEQGISQPTILSRADLEELKPLMLGEGIRALVAVPLVYQDRLLGRMMVYFNTPHVFTDTEIQLGQTIAAHVGFAIGRQRANNVLRAIVDGTSASTGEEFFRVLVRHLAGALHVRWAFVGESLKGDHDKIKTLALWAGDDFAENIEYDLAGTPCEGVMNRARCCYPAGVAPMFPQDPLLAEMGVDSYMGVRLSDTAGRSLGILVVMHDGPLVEPSQAEPILSVFAARASAELERLRAEESLKREQRWYASMSDQIDEAFLICAAETGQIYGANKALLNVLGFNLEELQPMTLHQLVADHPSSVDRYLARHVDGVHHTIELARYRTKSGAPREVEASASVFISEEHPYLFIVIRPADMLSRRGTRSAQHANLLPTGAV